MSTQTKIKKTVADYPQLVSEWHPTKNGDLKPEDISHGSQKKIWWKCNKGNDHEWISTSNARTNTCSRNKGGCPICSGRKVVKSNCLQTIQPDISSEWHPIKNNISPSQVTSSSSKKVWWRCNKDKKHEWLASVENRTRNRTGCPICSGRIATVPTSLAITHPELALEWHPLQNGTLTPYDVLPKSGIKAWWLCPNSHSYQAMIYNRSRNLTGCPTCNKSSAPENAIAGILQTYNVIHTREYKNVGCKHKRLLSFDFALYSHDTNLTGIIEYQGEQHFQQVKCWTNIEIQQKRDQIKREFCAKHNIPLLEITDEDAIESEVCNFLKLLNLIPETNP